MWRFNNQLLADNEFCEKMENTLLGVQRVYSHLDNFNLWELIKFEAKSLARETSIEKALEKGNNRFNLYSSLSTMQNELLHSDIEMDRANVLAENIQTIKNELKVFEIEDAQKAAFRCRLAWQEGGEKSCKYFWNLEKRNFVTKTMYAAHDHDGSITRDVRRILTLQYDFYADLYTCDRNVDFSVKNTSGVQLNEHRRNLFEQEISPEELYDAMMTLRRGKTPGLDGLTIEFYHRFWKLLIGPLHGMYQQAMTTGQLPRTGRCRVINLIPKKGKDELFVKGWRPIVLLNYCYKIWAKAISNRLETVTSDLIGSQQCGFVKSRSIFSNIRTTSEIIAHLNKNPRELGVIIQIDFEKCFDRISHDSIKGTFKYFGFGNHFVEMLSLLYSDSMMCTVNNGYLSDYFPKERSTNQGCPASPQVFIYCSEVMTHLINQNPDINGITVHGVEKIFSQFADDTSAYLQYNQLCVNAFIQTLTCVEGQLGLKVSYEKTTVYRVGSLRNMNAEMYTQQNFTWSDGPIDTLGVTLNCDGSWHPKNFADILTKVRQTCENWYNRSLTLPGKVLVINTLIGSLFVYKLSIMSQLSETQIRTIENLLREFIWKGKKAKIALSTLQKLKDQGGLNLFNLRWKQTVLLISWVFSVDKDPFLATCAYNALAPKLGQSIWKCNIKPQEVFKLYDNQNFWTEVLYSWSKINYHVPSNRQEVLNEIIWYNSHIKINDLPVIWETWIDANILFIEDLVKENGQYKNSVQLNVNWLELEQIKSAIPPNWKKLLNSECNKVPKPNKYTELCKVKDRNKRVYNMLAYDKIALERYRIRWNAQGWDINCYEEFESEFKRLHIHCFSCVGCPNSIVFSIYSIARGCIGS